MPYDLFISYAHNDNRRGQVGELCDAITADFHKFAGRDLRVFFDKQDIPSMADWERRIAQGLRESRLFLAVLSPNYFASAYCRREWEEYVRYEAMRQCLGEGVAPIYFVELPGLDSRGVEQSIAGWVEELRKRQWCDLRPWHDAGNRALEDAHVAERLQSLQGEIKERLRRADRAQQSPTNIYRHNPQFVGRVRELTLLREALNERGSVGVVGHKMQAAAGAAAVYGLGGMGKTELALAYAHAFAWDYPGGRLLARCEGLDNFDLVLRQLAEPLHIVFTEEEQNDARRAGERILAELRRRDRSLLLLDNVTHPELLGPDVLMRLPPQGHVHVVATTRLGPAQLGGSPHDHTFVAVDELPVDDALALIRAHQPDGRFDNADEDAAARELVKLLAGFTLAVETAAIYLGRHAAPMAIASYTQRLRRALLAESEASAVDPAVAVRHKEKLLERTLAITFETLSDEQLHFLTLAALLPADQVALPWLRAVASERFTLLKPDTRVDADTAWQQLADSILSLRLVQPSADLPIVRMHRLVQEILKSRAGASATALEQALIAHIIWRAKLVSDGWAQHEYRWEIAPLSACASQWMNQRSGEGAWLANEVARPLKELGSFPEAERLYRLAIAATSSVFGENHPNLASCLDGLAQLLCATNRWAEAEPMMRRALAIDESFFGPNDPKVAFRLNSLALMLKDTNRLTEAEPLMRRALTISESRLGASHPAVAQPLDSLALLLMDTNRPREAEPLMRRALAIQEAFRGPEHPEVAVRVNNLASLLQITNRPTEAEPLRRRALVIWEKNFGEGHPQVAAGLHNLAHLLKDSERFSEAEPLMRRALAIVERSLGEDHPSVAMALENLAQLLQATNRLGEAESLMRRALAIDEKSYGPDHPNVAVGLNNLAHLLNATNRQDEAEPLMRRALTIDEKSYGPEHPNVAVRLHNLASLLKDTNRLSEAEPLMRRALTVFEKSLGPDHPDVVNALNNLAQLLMAAHRALEAEPFMRRVVETSITLTLATGKEPPYLWKVINDYADLLTQMANRPEQIVKKLNEVCLPLGISFEDGAL